MGHYQLRHEVSNPVRLLARPGGAVVGGVVGHATGSTAAGVIIGAAAGGIVGGIIGAEMDKQAKELKQNIPGATVERVGEGITVTFASGLLFDFDSDVIRPQSASNLRALGRQSPQVPGVRPPDRWPH
jgi:outer membrane protein OmpA-like peptidoglycan-associated protein